MARGGVCRLTGDMDEEGKRGGGPKTPEGKAKSSENSAKHGMRAKQFRLAADETQEEYDEHRANWWAQLGPESFLEEQMMNQLILNHWLMLRGNRRYLEAQIEGDRHEIELMQRYKTTAERAFYRSWAVVRQLKVDCMRYRATMAKLKQAGDDKEEVGFEAVKPVGEDAREKGPESGRRTLRGAQGWIKNSQGTREARRIGRGAPRVGVGESMNDSVQRFAGSSLIEGP